ncbi:hypothetical protein JCM3766R1_003525 [Sporobolomyces carnicolor]
MSGLRNKFRPSRHSNHDDDPLAHQFAPDGRNLSDTSHPEYDPATDPELRLRIVHTAAESIHAGDREESRRRFRRLASRRSKKTPLNSPENPASPTSSPLKGRRSIFGRKKRPDTADTALTTPTRGLFGGDDDQLLPEEEEQQHQLGPEQRAELERNVTRQNAIFEAQESARRQEKQDAEERTKREEEDKKKGKKVNAKERRVVYVNADGAKTNPKAYERNKVRTSKYTLISFLPKNLAEQFRRIANIYFLALVILQVFPIFGAASPQVAMLPLVAILAITGIKDLVEDLRRHSLDNEVNNSAVTRLGDWDNVNVPDDERPWWAVWKKSNPNHKVSKGVRKLREKEGTYDATFLYSDHAANLAAAESRDHLAAATTATTTHELGYLDASASSYTLESTMTEGGDGGGGAKGGGVMSYPPPSRNRSYTLESTPSRPSGPTPSLAVSARSRKSNSDVVSYEHATPGTAKWERTLWKKLEVGDVVLLKENDQIPADVVVLATSDPDGLCFVETKNLDGETNLKPRKSLKATAGIANEEDVEHARFWVDSEAPHANLYSYNGVLRWRSREDKPGMEHPVTEGREREMGHELQEAITINELLLRGCALRNTKWVIGLVLFTGADTKIMLNQGETPSKRSKIEKETNFNVLINFVVLILLCVGCAIGDGIYDSFTGTSAQYYEPGGQVSRYPVVNAFVTFGATLILFQNIVPISLVITVELVKTIQAFFIYQDIDMYYEPLDHPCVPKTWNISDDLGQIEYIFSDKTGTLTQNVMEFQKCAVGGVAYGEGITEAMMGAAKREGRETSALDESQNMDNLAARKAQMIATLKRGFENRFLQEDKVTLISPPLADELVTRSSQQQRLVDFWKALALCHTVLAERGEDDPDHVIDYKAESPDEAALVSAARDVGFVFLSRSNSALEIEALGQRETFVPLRTLAFNSSRKRMSSIVRCPDGRILLICKGADSVIYQRLAGDHDPEVVSTTSQQLEDFANAGLRTLCISSKYLTEEEFQKWSRMYDAACAAVEDREDEIEKACDLIERDLTILGATALEDKLQVGVPDAIAQLHRAGIKLWILTGDKLQTAIEIGFSCNLLTNEMDIMILSAESEEGTRAQIESGLDKVHRSRSGLAPLATDAGEKKDKLAGAVKTGGFAVVIDGETLRYALEDNLKPMFLELTTQCNAVVCCRVSPSQKALTVKLVKDGKNAMTLAIGDGANDVAMIQEAHIGVGIAGLEGAQASMSADYAVGQFRYLTKLLLVHGRWCYIRVADMHANFFYKNIVWTLTLFLYQGFCNFDSTYMYEYTLIMLFNLVFTSLPVAALGILDQDVSAKFSMAYPQLYRRGILGLEWTRPKFFGFMLDGLYQSAIAFFVPYLVFIWSPSHSVSGHDFSVWEFGTTVAACACTAANLFVGLHIRYWSWIVFVVIIGSILSFHVWIAIYSQFDTYFYNNELTYLISILFRWPEQDLYGTLNFWLSILIVQIVAIGPKYLWRFVHSAYYPQDGDIVREMAVLGLKGKGPDFDPEEAHYADYPPPAETREALPLVAPELGGPNRQRQVSAETYSEPYSPPTVSNSSANPFHQQQQYHQGGGGGGGGAPIPSPFGPGPLRGSSPFASPRLAAVPPQASPSLHHVPQSVPTVAIIGSTPRGSLNSRPDSGQPPPAAAAAAAGPLVENDVGFDVLAYQRQSMTGGPEPDDDAASRSGGFDLDSQSPLDAWRRGQAQAQVIQQQQGPRMPGVAEQQQQQYHYETSPGYAL